MKKYILIFLVLGLVMMSVLVVSTKPIWESLLSPSKQPATGDNSPANTPQPTSVDNSPVVYEPPATIITITGNGIYNIGGVCTIEVIFKISDLKVVADAEVPILDSQQVPFAYAGDLLFPGCHFVQYKQNAIVSPMLADDGSSKVCFGASPYLLMTIYYYLDNPGGGNKVWIPLPTTLEDNGRLVCAPAMYSGVYMPSGDYIIIPGTDPQSFTNRLFPDGQGGSVLPPPSYITITGSGDYAVGGICLIRAKYNITGLADDVQVKYPTEDTLKVPTNDVVGLFFYPGCQVTHYRDQVIKPTMTRVEGDWQICFAAIPDKTMTIYYYRDDLTDITPPWIALPTITENGLSCATPVDFSAVYAPVGK
jgi:hypothetical protein